MEKFPFIHQLSLQAEFFTRGTASFTEADSGFTPQPGLMTVANHIAHAAHTVDWFLHGMFSPNGFDLDFPAHEAAARQVTSLIAARAQFARAYAAAIARVETATLDELMCEIAPGPIMGGAKRVAVFAALGDHTAHHRGVLAVYARLAGRIPAMPYA